MKRASNIVWALALVAGISGALAQSGGNRRGPNIPPVARPSAEKPSRAPREDLKKIGEKWNDINDRWGKETTRNMEAMEKINNMPEGNPKAQAAAAEAAQHRANSRDLGLERDAVHDEIIKEVNQRVAKGQTEASAPLTKTTGTKANDPGFQGMKSDNDLGGGARTADKVGEVLEDMGIKIKPKIKGGTIEFGDNLNITINKQGKMGPVGSGAHDAQTTVNAGNKETYVSVSMKKPDGTQQPGTDYVEVQDHKKKATPGMEAKPEDLATHPEAAHDMIKGTLKTMDHLSDSEVQQIMDKNNIPGEAKDFRKKMQDIKEGRAKLDPAELEKLQKTSRDIFEKAEQKTGSQADSELEQARQEVDRLKQAGDHDGARKLDSEVKDSRAKKEAVEKANRELADNVRKNGLSEEGKGAGKPTEVKGKGGETSTGKTAEGAGKGPAENPLGTTGKTKSGTSTPSGEPPSGQTGKVNEGTPGGTGQGKGSETSTGKTVEGLGKGSGKSTGGGGGEGPGGRPPDTFVGGGKGSGKSAGNGPDLPPEMPGGGGKAPGESTVGVGKGPDDFPPDTPGSGKAAKPEGTKTPNSKVTMEGPEGRDSGVKSTEPEVPGTKSGKPAPETMAKAPDAPKVDTPKVEGPEVPGTTKPGATVEIPKTESVATKPAVTDGPTGGKVETPSTPKVEGAGPKVVEAPTGPTVSEAPGGKGRVEIHEFDLPGAIAKALGATPPTAPPGIGGRLFEGAGHVMIGIDIAATAQNITEDLKKGNYTDAAGRTLEFGANLETLGIYGIGKEAGGKGLGWWGASSAIAEANKKNQENYDQKSEMALRNAHVNTDELKNIMEAHAKGDDAPLNNKFNQLKITPPVLIVEKPPTADDTPWERAGELKDGMVKNLEDAGKFVKGMGQNALDAGKELIKGVPSGMAPDKEGLINNLVSHGASLDEAQKAVDALYEHPDTSKAVRDLSNMLKEKEALKNAKPEPWRPGQDVDLTSRTDDLKNNEPGAGVGVPDNVSLKPMDILQWIGKTKSDKVDENTKSSMGINQGNQQVAGASTSGDQQNMAAGNTRDQAGADAQNTMNQSANQTAAEQQKNSWKNVLGDSLAQSLAAGGAGFGGAVGGQAAAQAGSTLWGSGHPSPGVGQPLGPAVDGKSADATGTQGGTPGSSAVGSPTSLGGKAGTLAKGSPGTKGGKSGTVAKGGPGAKGKPVSGAGAQPEAGAESTPKGCYDSYIKTYGKPTGYMSDGRPYWGDGSKNNPFTSHDIPRPIIGTVIKDPGAVGLAPVAAGKKTPSGQPTTTSTPKTEYCSKCGRPMTYVTKAAPGDPNGPLSRWYNCPYCDAQKTVKKPTPSGPNSVIMGEDWMKKPIPIKCPACKIGTINADAPYPKHPYCPNCNWVLN